MVYDFAELKKQVTDTEDWLKKEFGGIRTGRATPSLLDGVLVESYGSRVPINQLATISIEDARTLRITPWDLAAVGTIEKAITNANLGVSVATDEKGNRVIFPELTTERREALLKSMKGKLEQARITLRGERDKVWGDIQKKEHEAEISEDEKFGYKDDMQEIIDEGNKKLDEMVERKEKEILEK